MTSVVSLSECTSNRSVAVSGEITVINLYLLEKPGQYLTVLYRNETCIAASICIYLYIFSIYSICLFSLFIYSIFCSAFDGINNIYGYGYIDMYVYIHTYKLLYMHSL